jgi:antitoxin HigA-1
MSGNPLLAGLAPMHPGEILRDVILPETGLPKTEVARRLGISRQTLYDLIDERQPVTPAMALRLGRLFNNAPEFWANLQRDYDLRTLAVSMASELDAIEPVPPRAA